MRRKKFAFSRRVSEMQRNEGTRRNKMKPSSWFGSHLIHLIEFTRLPGINWRGFTGSKCCEWKVKRGRWIWKGKEKLTSTVSMMLQHWPTEVITCLGLIANVSAPEGTEYERQYPRHALVVTENLTHPGIFIILVIPVADEREREKSLLAIDSPGAVSGKRGKKLLKSAIMWIRSQLALILINLVRMKRLPPLVS